MRPLSDIAAEWTDIRPLLDKALALSPAQRLEWLDALPPDRTPLKDMLARLLEVQAGIETGDFLGTLPKLDGVPSDGAAAADAGAPQPGDEVGPYRLIRELSEGGMGSVWLPERADG